MKQPNVQKIDEKTYKYKAFKLILIEHPSYISVYKNKNKADYIKKVIHLIRDNAQLEK